MCYVNVPSLFLLNIQRNYKKCYDNIVFYIFLKIKAVTVDLSLEGMFMHCNDKKCILSCMIYNVESLSVVFRRLSYVSIFSETAEPIV